MTLYICSPQKELYSLDSRWAGVKGKLANGSYLLDTRYNAVSQEEFRYGIVTNGNWVTCHFEEFPPELKTYLLLLGVS